MKAHVACLVVACCWACGSSHTDPDGGRSEDGSWVDGGGSPAPDAATRDDSGTLPDRPEPPARDAGGLPEAGPADAGIPERDATVDPLDIRRECLAICAHIVRCAMTGDAAECADDCAEVEPALVNLACEEAVRRGLACFIGATCDELAAGACEVEADLVSATCSGRQGHLRVSFPGKRRSVAGRLTAMRTVLAKTGLALAGLLGLSGTAAAEDLVFDSPAIRLSVFGGVHLAGSTRTETLALVGGAAVAVDLVPDDVASFGTGVEGGIGLEGDVFDFVAIGGRLTFTSWSFTLFGVEDTVEVVSLAFVPRLRVVLGPFEPYGAVALGLSGAFLPDSSILSLVIDLGLGDGYFAEFFGGLAFAPAPFLRVFVEGGWGTRWFADSFDIETGERTDTIGVEFRAQQPFARGGIALRW